MKLTVFLLAVACGHVAAAAGFIPRHCRSNKVKGTFHKKLTPLKTKGPEEDAAEAKAARKLQKKLQKIATGTNTPSPPPTGTNTPSPPQTSKFQYFITKPDENHYFSNDYEKLVFAKINTQNYGIVKMIKYYIPGSYISETNSLSSICVNQYKKKRPKNRDPPFSITKGGKKKSLELHQKSSTTAQDHIEADFYVQIPEQDPPDPDEDGSPGLKLCDLLTDVSDKSMSFKENSSFDDFELHPGDWLFMEVTAEPTDILDKFWQLERAARVLSMNTEEEANGRPPIDPKAYVVCVNGVRFGRTKEVFDYIQVCYQKNCFKDMKIFTGASPLFIVWTPSQNSYETIKKLDGKFDGFKEDFDDFKGKVFTRDEFDKFKNEDFDDFKGKVFTRDDFDKFKNEFDDFKEEILKRLPPKK